MFHEGEEYETRDKPTTNAHSPFRINRNVQVTGEIAIGNRKKKKENWIPCYCGRKDSLLHVESVAIAVPLSKSIKTGQWFYFGVFDSIWLKIVDAVSSVIVFDGNVNCLSSGCTVDPRRPRKTKWTSVCGSIIYLFVIFPMGEKTIFVINDFCPSRRIRAKRKSCGFSAIFWNVNYPIPRRNIWQSFGQTKLFLFSRSLNLELLLSITFFFLFLFPFFLFDFLASCFDLLPMVYGAIRWLFSSLDRIMRESCAAAPVLSIVRYYTRLLTILCKICVIG